MASVLFATFMAFVPLNVDSQYRFERGETLTVSGSGFAVLFSEPATLLLAKATSMMGADTGRPLQILMAAVCFFLIYNILDRSLLWSSVALLYPPMYLLVFNIQGAGMAYLGTYFILKKNNWQPSELFTLRSGVFVSLLLLCHVSVLLIIAAYWLSCATKIFASLRLSKKRAFWWGIATFGLLVITIALVDYTQVIDLITALLSKLERYREASYSSGSWLHLILGGCFLLLLFLITFRGSLTYCGLTMLYLAVMVLLSTAEMGLKLSSRLMFILDVLIILELLTLLKQQMVWRRDSMWKQG